ncbi:hypothetical protein Q31b_29890 [Novipirellula aureliae]|uniref:Uncharacterized protein n=1 Tax=Novipirellula aureliae TaxID=2527966 RepID=A0A5C6DXY1_9BACT|nr:hypothetical protein [Novipirellula aureliae]TWU41540.1 hypothetical protein Q31b_29890 [Novipirellula aureliae]
MQIGLRRARNFLSIDFSILMKPAILIGPSVLIGISLLAGCSPNEVTEAGKPTLGGQAIHTVSNSKVMPQEYLRNVFARYRDAGSYRDKGQVRLQFMENGKPASRTAPLGVWFYRDLIYLRAYDTRLWSDQEGLAAWLVDPSTEHFDSQVLRLPPLGPRPKLTSLFSDPILAERVSAGLAGPPPQLEWLFSDQPMKALFNPKHQFSFGDQATVDGGGCQSVHVQANADRYTFWIDTKYGVIRQIDLPPIAIPSEPNQPTEKVTLSLELVDATFDAPTTTPETNSLPKKPKLVTRFIPLPPPAPPSILGKPFAGFELLKQTTAGVEPTRPTVYAIVYLANDQGSLVSATNLQTWIETFPPEWKASLHAAAIIHPSVKDIDAKTLAYLHDQVRLPWLEEIHRSESLPPGFEPGNLILVDHTGQIVWFQPDVSPQSLPALGAIAADVHSGVDVPQRIREQSEQERAAYKTVLKNEHNEVVRQGLAAPLQ